MSNPYPHELQFSDIYITPWIPALLLAFVLSVVTVLIANKIGVSKYVVWHRYLFLGIMMLYLVVVDDYIIRIF